jgi:hypothetical protein
MIDDLWYRNAIVYCLSVATYIDADGDGTGDFKDPMRRLDYLQGFGVTAIWLMRFSPLRGATAGRWPRACKPFSTDHSLANESGEHCILLKPYGYRWYSAGGLSYLLREVMSGSL